MERNSYLIGTKVWRHLNSHPTHPGGGLRFGAQFMLSVLPYSSNSVSAP